MKSIWLAAVAACGILAMAGCDSSEGTATEKDKAALDKLAKEGIGTSNPPPGQGGAPTNEPIPANGKVDAP